MNILAVDFNTNTDGSRAWIEDWTLFNGLGFEHGRGLLHFFNTIDNNCVAFNSHFNFVAPFILDFLLRNGYRYSTSAKLSSGEFSTLIAPGREIYFIKVCLRRTGQHRSGSLIQVEFRDAKKTLLANPQDIAESFGFDWRADLTDAENITRIVYLAQSALLERGLTGLTIANCALKLLKKTMPSKAFNAIFTPISNDVDRFIRRAYYGGLCAVREPKKVVRDINVYDKSSAYPAQMLAHALPYGEPKHFDGRYTQDAVYPLWVQRFKAVLRVKPDRLPWLPDRRFFNFEKDRIIDTQGQFIELTLTQPDFARLADDYEICDLKYIDGFKFMSATGLFDDYIIPLYEEKSSSTGAQREIAKRLLNALTGKLAAIPQRVSYKPILNNDVVEYVQERFLYKPSLSIVNTAYVTAYQRFELIEAIQAVLSAFKYCDTDSIHMDANARLKSITEPHRGIGAWNKEKHYDEVCYFAPKIYKGYINGSTDFKAAGVPRHLLKQIDDYNYKQELIQAIPTPCPGGMLNVNRNRPLCKYPHTC